MAVLLKNLLDQTRGEVSPDLRPMLRPERQHIPLVSDQELRPSTRMLLAMTAHGMPMYQGTVPAHVKEQRRRRNKAARRARRVHRG